MELTLRQSGSGIAEITDLASSARTTTPISEESVGAGISDIVQLKNGHGAVLAGLIGERDTKVVSKVPVLGDLPWIGVAFRSTSIDRNKTEIVIFLEVEILPSDSFQALPTASRDFLLSQGYCNSEVLCNPLEFGLQRSGVGSYLPPRSHRERIYWERLGRRVQRSSTDAHDIVR